HVDDMVALIRDIAAAEGWRYKIATIYADAPQSVVRDRLAAGRVTSCSSSPVLETKAVDDAVKIVAQMGAEPFIRVLQEHPDVDVIIAGRAYDPAPHAAFCAVHGIDPGVAWHAGKILECGAVCAEPKGRVILATMRRDSFELEPMNPAERCTPASVAAHTLAGNFALPLNPPENPIGPVCAFTVYHLMEVDDPCELFPIRVYEA
ncbi:MAG: acyclic terpene utilization AtuA family protein, partial [Janthinobacterium lividum]